MQATIERLKQIIADDLDVGIRLESIPDDASLLEDGIGLDSVATMEFISIIEEKFGFEFSDEELGMETFKNLQTLSQFIMNKEPSQG